MTDWVESKEAEEIFQANRCGITFGVLLELMLLVGMIFLGIKMGLSID